VAAVAHWKPAGHTAVDVLPAAQYCPAAQVKMVVMVGQYDPAGQRLFTAVPAGHDWPRLHGIAAVAGVRQ